MSMWSTQRSQLPSQQRDVLAQELSHRELYDNVIQVLPNLRAVAAAPAFCGPSWRLKREQHGVRLHEYDAYMSAHTSRPRAMSDAGAMSDVDIDAALRRWPWTRMGSGRLNASAVSYLPPLVATPPLLRSAVWPNMSSGVPFAAVAQCELSCHVSEAMDVLFSTDAARHDATMRALWGTKYRRGDQLSAERYECLDDVPTDRFDDVDATDASETQPGNLSVHATVLAPRHDLHMPNSRSHHGQQLCFTMYSHRATRANEAFVVMKTLPKRVHEQLVEPSERAALRGGIDHIAVGYHLTGSYSDVAGHQTKLVMCAYASTFSGSERPEVMQWRIGLRAAHDRAHAEAKYVVRLLALAASEFERVVRRRRFGLQPFTTVTVERTSTNCSVCDKRFGLLRRTELCQLCGHAVCRRCSRKYEVESLSSNGSSTGSSEGVRKHRACFTCASRVENGALQSCDKMSTVSTWYETVEEPDAGADDVDADADRKHGDTADRYYQSKHQHQHHHQQQRFDRTLVLPLDVLASPKPGHQLAEALFSPHPLDRARALEVLKVAVKQVTTQPAADWNKPLDPALVGKYLEARQRLSRISSKGSASYDDCDMDSGRSFPVFYQQHAVPMSARSATFADKSSRGFSSSPLAHEPRSAARVDVCVTDRDGDSDSDRDGLDAICEVAAQRMSCPMAFVSVLGRDEQHVVGTYQVPECVYRLPRNQSTRSFGLLADGEPLIVHHPMQDARLRQMPLVRDAGVHFFAGFPIKDRHGAVVASICTIDTLPHDTVSRNELAAMAALTTLAADTFDKSAAPAPFTPRARHY